MVARDQRLFGASRSPRAADLTAAMAVAAGLS